MRSPANTSAVVNALSFDVEDYFQVSNFESLVGFDNWSKFHSRVERNTERILEILAEHEISATFFVLGWEAERCPALVRRIAAAGHELATHGYRHRRIFDLQREQFREDLRKSIDLIEQAGGQKVLGHRAPSFSVTERSLWALDVMQQAGLAYDSSIFPVRHPSYGIRGAPRQPYEIRPGFWEFPIATVRLGRMNLPVAGGGYFRLYPYPLTRWALRRINAEQHSAIVYLHPWEIDPDQPRMTASWQARFRHYNNLKRTALRLRRMCGEFRFTTARQVLGL